MLGNCDVIALVNVANEATAREFYAGTLGLPYGKQDPFAVVFDANGITLRVTTIPGFKPKEHPALGWSVPDIAATVAALVQKGVVMEIYPGLGQDDQGIWTSPDGTAKVAFFKDPDGNLLSLAQN